MSWLRDVFRFDEDDDGNVFIGWFWIVVMAAAIFGFVGFCIATRGEVAVRALSETACATPEDGLARIERWPEGIVFFYHGQIVWLSWRDAAA